MLHFLKKKPFLTDFIPNDFVDIHSHLLPAIDDGATSIEDTHALITSLQEIGFKKFITTPHIMGEVWTNTKSGIQEKHKETLTELSIVGIEKKLSVAAEYMMDGEFQALYLQKDLLTIKDNFILVEMSYLCPPISLYDILFDLQVAGYIPILAHPERYNFFHNSLNEYRKLKAAGCFFQLNMLSTTGYYGEKVAKAAELLLLNGLIDYVGSDVHHSRHLEYLKKKIVLKNYDYLHIAFQNNSIFNF
jgi:protein-tyrosine phosphatase